MKDITNDKIGRVWHRYINAAIKNYKGPISAEEIEAWRANFYAGAYATIELVFAPFHCAAQQTPLPAETALAWLIELKVELELEIIEAAAETTSQDEATQAALSRAQAAHRAIRKTMGPRPN